LTVLAGAQLMRLTDYPYPASIPKGGFANYVLTLTAIPQSDVQITIVASSPLSVSPSIFTFSPATWNVPQEVHIVAIMDHVIVKPSPFDAYLAWQFSSADGNFSSVYQAPTPISVKETQVGWC
jgi:hypothetical protein